MLGKHMFYSLYHLRSTSLEIPPHDKRFIIAGDLVLGWIGSAEIGEAGMPSICYAGSSAGSSGLYGIW